MPHELVFTSDNELHSPSDNVPKSIAPMIAIGKSYHNRETE